MSLPDAASLEAFSLAELREVVGRLVGEVRRLHSDNSVLQARVNAQQVTIAAARAENQALRDEVARLKGLPPRPPSRPSGMEQATQPGAAGKDEKRPKRPRGVKRDAQAITAERVLKVAVPAGARFKGYEDILVRDLRLSAEVIRYRRERWLLPSGETVLAPLPAGIVGGFGPELRRFVLALHVQGQVTTERLTALLNGIGMEISKRQVVRLLAGPLDDLVAEDQEVLRAGLATARWITVDDTAARHARKDGFTTQVGDHRFTVFRTGPSKSRETFLSVLRAGYTDYVVNAAALDYMRGHGLSGQVIAQLDAHPVRLFADASAWSAHLVRLGIGTLAITPDPVQVATEGALWGAICHHGLLGTDAALGAAGTVIVSDGAGQFRVGTHALCWVHAERLVHKLVPATPNQRRAVEVTRADVVALRRPEGLGVRSLPTARRGAAGALRAHLRAANRLRHPGSPAGPAAPAQVRTAARAAAPRDPAAHQRLGERHPRLRDQAQDLRRHHEHGRTHRARRHARPDEDLRQARRLVLPLPRRPPACPRRHRHSAASQSRPSGRNNSLIARESAPVTGTHAQAVSRCGLRRCRYIGLAKTRLQHVLTAVAINLVRVAEWCAGTPIAKTRRSRFAALQITV